MSDDKDKWLRVVRRAVDGTAWGEGPLALSKAVADSVQRQLIEDLDQTFGPDEDEQVDLGILGFRRPQKESTDRPRLVGKIASIMASTPRLQDKAQIDLVREVDQLLAMYEAMHGIKL